MKNKEYTSFLDEDVTPVAESKKKNSSVLSKQTKLIVVLIAFIAVMIPVYIFFVIPMLEDATAPSPDNTVKVEATRGEVLTSKGKIAMMQTFKEEELSRVTVKNSVPKRNADGTFTNEYREWVMYMGKSGSWAIEGYDSTSYDASSVITILATFITMEVESKNEFESFDDIDLKAYGFDGESKPASYTVETKNGDKYTVTLGNKIPTGTGYYAYFTDKDGVIRPTVYIISAYYANLMGCSMYDLVSPVVVQMLDQSNYVPETFSIYRGKKQYFNIKKYSNEELKESESGKVSHLFIEIDGVKYEYDASAYYSVMLYEKLMPGINGTRAVYAKPDNIENVPREVLLAYGIDTEDPYRQLFFRAKTVFATGSSHMSDQMLVFSPKTENNSGDAVYYVFNVVYNTIVEVSAEAVSFIEKDYTEYCENYIVLFPFYNIDEITFDSTALPDAYVQSGMKPVLETFIVKATDDYKLLDAIIKSTGKQVPNVAGTKITGLTNFGQWYSVLLSLSTQTEIPSGVLDKIDLSKPDITVTIKTVGGKTHEMCFYLYNSRHAYYTFNGLGRAYVKYDDIVNMLDSTYKLINGKQVNAGYTAAPDPTVEPTDTPTVTPDKTEQPKSQTGLIITLFFVLGVVVIGGGGVVALTVIKGKKKNGVGKK